MQPAEVCRRQCSAQFKTTNSLKRVRALSGLLALVQTEAEEDKEEEKLLKGKYQHFQFG